jgi:hypothetical protein
VDWFNRDLSEYLDVPQGSETALPGPNLATVPYGMAFGATSLSPDPYSQAAAAGLNILSGLIKTSKNPQRVQQAQQMYTAVKAGNLSALQRLEARAAQFATDDAGFAPAIRALIAEGVITNTGQFVSLTPWYDLPGKTELYDSPNVFSTVRPAGAQNAVSGAGGVPGSPNQPVSTRPATTTSAGLFEGLNLTTLAAAGLAVFVLPRMVGGRAPRRRRR